MTTPTATANTSIKPLIIGSTTLKSRLILGTGKYDSPELMQAALEASGTDMVTVAVRRDNVLETNKESIYTQLDWSRYTFLPNTAGCYTADDAVRYARLARELCEGDLIKLEVIGDERTLFPDVEATLEACKILVAEGFTVLAYTNDDPMGCKKLAEAGAAVVMPLLAPIGSGAGIQNRLNLQIILEQATTPIIVDAGVGTASDAAIAMELGASGVLMNTAVAKAKDPVAMATAMRYGVQAGYLARRAGRIGKKLYAQASSPIEGMLE